MGNKMGKRVKKEMKRSKSKSQKGSDSPDGRKKLPQQVGYGLTPPVTPQRNRHAVNGNIPALSRLQPPHDTGDAITLSSSSLHRLNTGTLLTPPSTPSRSRTPNSSSLNLKQLQNVMVVAMYSYEAKLADEVSFNKGDRMEIIGDSENCDWYLVRHETTGQEGYIPGNYVVVGSNSVKAEDWWYPLDRKDAERTLLNPELAKGTFLIRERQGDIAAPYAISVKDYVERDGDYSVKHYKIRTLDNGGCYLTPHLTFQSIVDLVRFYSTEVKQGLCCPLKTACPRKKPLLPFREMEVPRSQIRLVRKVGNGYFGEVWVGKMKNHEDVAVKMMKHGKMSTQNFIKEAKVLHQLRHPKLVPLRGVCTITSPLMIITELMVKGDLLKYLRADSGRKVKLPQLIDMAGQVASGMSFLEKCSYIHRDLRAANVLVGENNVVKIADFGLARLVASDDDIYIMSNQSKVPIKWSAPEALFHHQFSSKSDVWSYGVLLYEIFTYGMVPYAGVSTADIAKLLIAGYRMSKPPSRPLPDDVYATMLRCWHDVPESRPTFSFLQTYFEDFILSDDGGYRDPVII